MLASGEGLASKCAKTAGSAAAGGGGSGELCATGESGAREPPSELLRCKKALICFIIWGPVLTGKAGTAACGYRLYIRQLTGKCAALPTDGAGRPPRSRNCMCSADPEDLTLGCACCQ